MAGDEAPKGLASPPTSTAIPHVALRGASGELKLTVQKAGSTLAETFIGDAAAKEMVRVLEERDLTDRETIVSRLQQDQDIAKVLAEMDNPFSANEPEDHRWAATRDRLRAVQKELQGALSPKLRRELHKEAKGLIHKWRREIGAAQKAHDDRRRWLDANKLVLEEAQKWSVQPMVLQRLEHSAFHQMRRAPHDGEFFMTHGPAEQVPPDMFESLWGGCEVFVVEHDWARAFDKATGIEGTGARLPYEVCAFEFKVSGHHVIATCFECSDDAMSVLLTVRTKSGWLTFGTVVVKPDGTMGYCKSDKGFAFLHEGPAPIVEWHDAVKSPRRHDEIVWMIYRQIRCILIALSAEVATKEIMRLPWKSNRPPPAAIRQPTYSYHVISLAHRRRYDRRPRGFDEPPGTRKRLHFRRAHERHYQTYKVDIDWMLVGDPELGWIDKHYKL